ncbi:hypothetical protein ACFFGF_04935 [Asaia lannensis]|uniref:Small CPxCG-related zinc finger protein n=1 Tax=Asaia lannensis NBRC 102526 TaxID=1307926 RepID=A0ABT1CIE4_9PROT|nr:hypothetical protein [Asaia lannensis]MCO6160642.1 hypothetical protein [Asaia lannensis NBRC 102526]GBR02122.1 hypothetical protein AA102526_2724 [Asaia lannensis NBRC 102526]
MSEIDTSGTDEIVCPYCGHEHEASWEFNLEGVDGLVDCDACERKFRAMQEVTVRYSSRKIEKSADD